MSSGTKNGNLPGWPRLMSVKLASSYLSIGAQTLRDYVAEGLISPVRLPGSILKDRAGNVLARPRQRRLGKFLFDRNEIDAFVDSQKGGAK